MKLLLSVSLIPRESMSAHRRFQRLGGYPVQDPRRVRSSTWPLHSPVRCQAADQGFRRAANRRVKRTP